MKRLSIVLVVLAIAANCFQQAAPAEEVSGIPKEIVKELDSLVGTWNVEAKIGDTQQKGEMTFRWERTENKEKICLSGRSLFIIDGREIHGVGLVGWNAGRECIEDRGFDANGGNGVYYWKVESPGHWKGEQIIVAEGNTLEGKVEMIRNGDSEFVFEAEYPDGNVTRAVMRKVKRERKKKAND